MSAERLPNGRFAPGKSGNPGGRPKEVKEIRALAQQKSPEVIQTLFEIVMDSTLRPGPRVAAAKELLDRALGRPLGAAEVLKEEQKANAGQTIQLKLIDPEAPPEDQ